MITEILSFFKLKKFTIICHNREEWFNVQVELIKNGYRWEGCWFVNDISFSPSPSLGDIYLTPADAGVSWSLPIIIKNYRSGDNFGGKYLIMDDYNFVIKKYKDIKLCNANSFLRKNKLKIINKHGN